MMEQEWIPITGLPDCEMTTTEPWRFRERGRERKQCTDRGYKRVTLTGVLKRVHRIVAEQFIPNPKNLKIVDHISGNTIENSIQNLRWCTTA
jgi:hypothetical protein